MGWEALRDGRVCGEMGVQGWDLGCRGGGGGITTGFRAGIWGAVLRFEGQGRRGVRPWDLGCREGFRLQTQDLGCRGKFGVHGEICGAEGDLGYRMRIWCAGGDLGCRDEIWGSGIDLGCSPEVQGEIWGVGGDFEGAEGDLGHTPGGAGAPPFPEAGPAPRGSPGPGGLQLRSSSFITAKHAPFLPRNAEISPKNPDPSCLGMLTPGWSTLR